MPRSGESPPGKRPLRRPLLSFARPYRAQLRGTRASAVILAREERDATALPRILCDDPYVYYARVAQLFGPESRPVAGVHARAVVEAGAEIPASATVGPGCHIGRGARLGEPQRDRCQLHDRRRRGDRRGQPPGALGHGLSPLRHRQARIDSCRRVIGADGFGMASDAGRWIKIPQTGRAVIGDDVEIGANTTIDRGALDDTVIEDGVKLDNQIQIGHNVRIGAHTAMAGCAAVAGSTRIGAHCAIEARRASSVI